MYWGSVKGNLVGTGRGSESRGSGEDASPLTFAPTNLLYLPLSSCGLSVCVLRLLYLNSTLLLLLLSSLFYSPLPLLFYFRSTSALPRLFRCTPALPRFTPFIIIMCYTHHSTSLPVPYLATVSVPPPNAWAHIMCHTPVTNQFGGGKQSTSMS